MDRIRIGTRLKPAFGRHGHPGTTLPRVREA